MADEIISVTEIVKTPRGRKAEMDAGLVAKFKKLGKTQAVVLTDAFGEVPKDKRGTVSGKIRRHFQAAHPGRECRINYTPAGVPQVSWGNTDPDA